jgi:hypothetical protein
VSSSIICRRLDGEELDDCVSERSGWFDRSEDKIYSKLFNSTSRLPFVKSNSPETNRHDPRGSFVVLEER